MKKCILFLLLSFACVQGRANQGTVVLIHGFLLGPHHMFPIAKCIESAGFNSWLYQYPSRKRFICQHAESLNSTLRCIAAQCPGQPIHFVTHSIGALVLRAALNMPECPCEAKIGKAVLLAPPNRGSLLARHFKNNCIIRLGIGDKSGWELMNYEPCDIVCRFGNFPDTMSVLVVAGCDGIRPWFGGRPNDGMLAVEETSLDTFYYQTVLDVSHGDLLKESSSLRAIQEFLCFYPQSTNAPACSR